MKMKQHTGFTLIDEQVMSVVAALIKIKVDQIVAL